ncbi:hypothetical protein JTE88_08945 [Arcanobacterium phocisimile]|uniref:Protein kinase domain-containing protein n=1 Tax=Arcanobacterium phocisimile TaxID=1302235 RepID=A0ABX7IHG5_9ACTO|nr:hypothetical protein [Arcanobacterium phocisimile]QRV02175.1 hypothetical protein JTE88_08945 [Arcanobacterium phocisimile]
MGKTYAFAGKRIADRFELMFPVSTRANRYRSSVWAARDTARSVEIRAIVIDPDFPDVDAVLDAARRTSYLQNSDDVAASMVMTVAVVGQGGDYAVFTEVPPGRPLSDFLADRPLEPELVRSIIGEITSAINSVRHQGIRHLALDADDIYITDAGNVVIDGYGINAVMNSVPRDLETPELDRREAEGLVSLMASLLLGRHVSRETFDSLDTDLIQDAVSIPDLPTEIKSILETYLEGKAPASSNNLLLELVPWEDIDVTALSHFAPTVPEIAVDTAEPADIAIDFSATAFPKIFDDDNGTAEEGNDQENELGEGNSTSDETPVADSDMETAGTDEVFTVADTKESDVDAELLDDPVQTPEQAAEKINTLLGISADADAPEIDSWPKIGEIEPSAPQTDEASESAENREDSETLVVNETSEGQDEPGVVAARAVAVIEDDPQITPPVPSTTTKLHGSLNAKISQASSALQSAGENIQKKRKMTINSSTFVILILVAIVVIAAVFGISNLLKPLRDVSIVLPDSQDATSEQQDSEAKQASGEAAVKPALASVELVDPDSAQFFPDDDEPNYPENVGRIADGNPETVWQSWYFNEPGMGAISGIGLHAIFEKEAHVSALVMNIAGKGGNVQIKTGADPNAGELLYEGPVDGLTTVTFDQKPVTADLLIWFTELPVDNAGLNRISLADISVE